MDSVLALCTDRFIIKTKCLGDYLTGDTKVKTCNHESKSFGLIIKWLFIFKFDLRAFDFTLRWPKEPNALQENTCKLRNVSISFTTGALQIRRGQTHTEDAGSVYEK